MSNEKNIGETPGIGQSADPGVTKRNMGLYDSQTNETLLADHIYDASLLISSGDVCLIKYTNAKRGRIAQICHLDGADINTGSFVHYHIQEMNAAQLAEDSVFLRFAAAMGVEPMTLSNAIYDNQHPK